MRFCRFIVLDVAVTPSFQYANSKMAVSVVKGLGTERLYSPTGKSSEYAVL
jgi:hypothetical protein